ncbi:MAG: hypothetical protein ACFFCZ_28180 [Promethearchaeota archaeon]
MQNFFCPKCGAKLAKRAIDRKFTASSFSVLRDRLDLTLNNGIATRKFPPELKELATAIAEKIFKNHPDLDRTDLLWATCLFCRYTTFVAPSIPEQTTLHATLPDSDDYSRILKDYEQSRKTFESKFASRFGFVILIGLGCGVIMVIFWLIFIFPIFLSLFGWF